MVEVLEAQEVDEEAEKVQMVELVAVMKPEVDEGGRSNLEGPTQEAEEPRSGRRGGSPV